MIYFQRMINIVFIKEIDVKKFIYIFNYHNNLKTNKKTRLIN